jgi:hypothetical protein
MTKYNALSAHVAVLCPVAVSMLVACGSSDSTGPEALTQSESPAASDGVANRQSLEEWKRGIRSTRPPKAGCFSITYPAKAWDEVQCAPPPSRDALAMKDGVALPGHGALARAGVDRSTAPQGGGDVGDGTDWFAYASGSAIQDVVGSFPSVSGILSESDPDFSGDPANAYCLQINSNFFHSPLCGSYTDCLGEQQFEYSTTTVGGVFLEYWLVNYPPAADNNCPSGWSASNSTTCHQVSEVNPVPVQPVSNLGNLVLNASAKDPEFEVALDAVWLDTGGSTVYAMIQDATTLSLYQSWSEAEFNVVGDWDKTEAVFDVGLFGGSITVQSEITPVSYPGGTWLDCSTSTAGGFTDEYNNLDLSSTCNTNQGSSSNPTGSIQFTESLPGHLIIFP